MPNQESRASDMNSGGPRFNTHWGNILLHDFCLHVEKPLMPILAILRVCENPE